jgi:Tol biopolymer transport system component
MKRTRSSLVMLALLVAVACTSTAEPPSGSSSPGGGTSPESSATQSEAHGVIVFNRLASEGIAVYSLDLGSMTEERIRRVKDFVTLSPDGNRFLSAWPIPDGRIGPTTFDIDGSGYSLLPIDDPTLQVGAGGWSPDGSRFVAGAWDDTDPSREGLYTFSSTDGGGLVRLTAPENPLHDQAVGYSPEGSHVLFIRGEDPYDHSEQTNVFVVRKDGSGLVRLNPPATSSVLDGQSWSPDGKRVAFVAWKDGAEQGQAVFVVNADGTDAQRITPWSVTFRADWSPDGEWIAFDMADSESVPRDLYVVHPDGSRLTRITSNEDNKMSFAPAWSQNSRSLLFIRREYSADVVDLWTVNVDGTGMFQVTHEPAEYTGYRWLPETR